MAGSKHQRGNTVIGFVAGLVAGLLIAVAVALYMTKAPVPFMNRVQQQKTPEAVKPGPDGKLPDPNTALYSKPVEPPKVNPNKADAKTDPQAKPPPPRLPPHRPAPPSPIPASGS